MQVVKNVQAAVAAFLGASQKKKILVLFLFFYYIFIWTRKRWVGYKSTSNSEIK